MHSFDLRSLDWRMFALPFLVLSLGACQDAPPAPVSLSPDAIAGWRGQDSKSGESNRGELGLPEIEAAVGEASTPACNEMRRALGGGSLEVLLPCYRETAELLAVEALVAAEIDVAAESEEFIRENPQRAARYLLQAWMQRSRQTTEADESEIVAYYETHREELRRPARRTVWNIFRRHGETPENTRPDEIEAYLRQLKDAFEQGETFSALAREHSHSETRLRGGLVGNLNEGRLPKRLEKIVESLGEGEVSDPVPVRGGAVLLYVTGVTEGADLSLNEARRQVRRLVIAEKIAAQQQLRASTVEVPENARILSAAELLSALEDSPDQPVLAVEDLELTGERLLRLAGLPENAAVGSLGEDAKNGLVELYETQLQEKLFIHSLRQSTDPDDVALREEAHQNLLEDARTRVIDWHLRDEMQSRVDADPAKLKTYYEDNLPLYQTPLQFTLHSWDVPFDANPPQQMQRLEKLRAQLVAGEIDLAAAQADLGGEVRALGTLSLQELANEIPKKAQEYLLQVDESGYSVPFQQDDALHVLWLEERHEPRDESYEEAAEKVRRDYLARFRQQLYQDVVRERLQNAGFSYSEETLRRLLTSTAAP